MRLTGLIPLVSLLVYAPAGALHDVRSSGSLPAQSATPTHPIGIILKLKEGADPEACHQRIERKLRSTGRPSRDRRLLKARPRDPRSRARVARQRFGLERLQLAYAPKGRSVEETLAAYANDPDVEYAELDAVVHILDTVPNDPLYSRLWGLEKIGAPRAWDVERGDPGVVVAVIDTGIDDAHPDLLANLWINTGEIPGNGIDDDGNGFIDDVRGYDFVNEDGKPRDDNGHGTHVAGIVGAVGDNSTGVTGVNQRVSIMALKFLDGGGAGRLSDAIRAIDYSIAMGARVLNNSWGFDVDSQALHDAVSASQAAGQLFVAAAGNSPGDADVDPHFPSGLEHDNVLSVAATDRGDLLATFSNFGLVSVDLGAPGVDILSTTPRYSTEITAEFGRHYAELSGTSMAAPHVAGVAALLLARSSLLRYDEVRARILAGVDPVPGLEVATGGRLNAAASFAGLGIGGDSDPPVSVSDLTVVDVTERSVTLEWTASGEDGTVGRAALYDLRYAQDPITAASWDASTPVFDEPPPGEAGSMESALVEGLDQGQTYFFAVRVMDRSGNYSAISNTPSATTVALVPVAIQIDRGDEQIGESGSDLEEALRVIVVDAEGHGVSRIPVAFAITEGAPGAFLDPPDALTDEDGIASTSLVLGTVAPATAGVLHRVAVSSPGLTSAEFRLGAHALVDLTPIWRNEHAVRLLDVGDADQDGFGELLTATWSYEGIELALIEAQGNDSFEEVWSFLDPRWWSLYAHGAIGDVDGDGDMEIVVYAIPSGVTEFAVPLIFERTGENSYGLVSHPIVLRTEVRTEDGLQPVVPEQVLVTDVNLNGVPDVVFWGRSALGYVVSVWEHRGPIGAHEYEEIFFVVQDPSPPGPEARPIVADTDGDGRPELLSGQAGGPTYGSVRYEYNELTTDFEFKPDGLQLGKTIDPNSRFSLVARTTAHVVVDLDGDGENEVIAAGTYGCTCAKATLSAADRPYTSGEGLYFCPAGNLAVLRATADDTYEPVWDNQGTITCGWNVDRRLLDAASGQLNALPPGRPVVVVGGVRGVELAAVYASNPFPFPDEYLLKFWSVPQPLVGFGSATWVPFVRFGDLDADGRPELIVQWGGRPLVFEENLDTSQPFPPVLDPVGPRVATLWRPLVFGVSGSDLNRDLLSFSATRLPPGADFDALRRVFAWTPDTGQEGQHVVTFRVSDGALEDSESTTILVRRDLDRDGVPDPVDNCPRHANAAQGDFDLDSIGDPCDPDGGPPTPRSAPTVAQRNCISSMNIEGAAVLRVMSRDNTRCLKAAGRNQIENLGGPGQTQTAQACLTNDVKGIVARRVSKLVLKENRRCLATSAQLPGYGYTGSGQVVNESQTTASGLVGALFGTDLDAAIVPVPSDSPGAGCQLGVLKRAGQHLDTLWKTLVKGKKKALRCSSDPGSVACTDLAGFDLPIDLERALIGYVAADPKGKVARSAARILAAAENKCGRVLPRLGALFPGTCSSATSPTTLAACVEREARCRFCTSLSAFDAFSMDCDTFDDDIDNDTCGLVLTCAELCDQEYEAAEGICTSGVDSMVCDGHPGCIAAVDASRSDCLASAAAVRATCTAGCP